MVLTGRLVLAVGLGAVVVAAAGIAGASPTVVAAAWLALCGASAAIDVALAGSPRAVAVTRNLPRKVRRGEPVTSELRLQNRGRRLLRGEVRDAWSPSAGAPVARASVLLAAGETRTLRIPLLPRRRGEVAAGFVVVRSVGPWGLAGRQAVIDVPGSIRVLPPFASRRHLPARVARLRELDGNVAVLLRGQGTEFDGLREYVRGDDVRSIDWRATARSNEAMLRIWRPERDRHVVVVIDTGRTSAVRVGDGVRLDAAMDSALLVCALAAEAGDHVHVVMIDRAVRARVTRRDGTSLIPALVDAMSAVEPQLVDTDWTTVREEIRRLRVRPSLVVLLTAQDAPDSARGLLAALPSFAEDGVAVLVASAADSSLLPDAPGHAAQNVYRRAAVERADRDARRVGLAIQRAGAEVVVAEAERLPPVLADRYLALKSEGRL